MAIAVSETRSILTRLAKATVVLKCRFGQSRFQLDEEPTKEKNIGIDSLPEELETGSGTKKGVVVVFRKVWFKIRALI